MMDDTTFNLVNTQDARQKAELLFAEVRLQIAEFLPNADIRHIGATSVPGCLTKGDLDLVVRVPPENFDDADRLLSRLYARNEGSAQTGSFSAFQDNTRDPHLGIQLVSEGGAFDFFHQFAEALKGSCDLLNAYNQLKRDHVGCDMASYRRAKDAFVETVIADFRGKE